MEEITNFEIAKKLDVCIELLELLKKENKNDKITTESIKRIKLVVLELMQDIEKRYQEKTRRF